jgi:hypothetical protein
MPGWVQGVREMVSVEARCDTRTNAPLVGSADQFCINEQSNGQMVPVVSIKYKAPHNSPLVQIHCQAYRRCQSNNTTLWLLNPVTASKTLLFLQRTALRRKHHLPNSQWSRFTILKGNGHCIDSLAGTFQPNPPHQPFSPGSTSLTISS